MKESEHFLNENNPYIAHIRESDGKIQTVSEHLLETAEFAGKYAGKIGFKDEGFLLGLLHDFGKYSLNSFDNSEIRGLI